MTKYAIAAVCALFICQGFAKPLLEDGDIGKAAAAGDWAQVQKILKEYVTSRVAPPASQYLDAGSLQASVPSYNVESNDGSSVPRGRFYSQSEYQYARSSNNNGVVSEDKGGLGMINDNGRITYYKPSPSSSGYVNNYPSAFTNYPGFSNNGNSPSSYGYQGR